VSAAFTEQALEAGRPPAAELRVLEGLGHMLFLDHLDQSLPVVTEWLNQRLAATPLATEASAA
jgi:hypothetical protein